MATNWTPEQSAAIENTSQTLLLSAAAGSGKTATLTERLIRMICRKENPLRVDRMLVATFTKAAAAQLREKIGAALGKAIEADPENPFLAEQMLLLPLAKIRTIDSFCNDIVRDNTEPLGLPKTYRIPDKAESLLLSAAIMEEVVEDAYSGLITLDGLDMVSLADAFTDVSDEETLPSILYNLYTTLGGYRLGVSLLKENAKSLRDSLPLPFFKTPWGISLQGLLSRYLTELKDGYKRAAEDAFGEGGEGADPVFYENYTSAVFGEIAHLEEAIAALQENYSAAKAAFSSFSLYPLGKKRGGGELSEAALFLKSYRTYVNTRMQGYKESFFAWEEKDIPKAFLASASITESLYSLLTEFDRRFLEEKQRRGLCDFSDLSRYALALLLDENGEKTPFAKEMAAKYDAVCIDEYQDVNEVQHLLFEAVSTETNRFMVGDIKQSIYAFRGGQPSIFSTLRNTLPPPEKGEKAAVQYLSVNFRSASPVIGFCNDAFDFLFGILGGSIHYSDKDRLQQGRKEKGPLPTPSITLTVPLSKSEREEGALPFECRAVAKAVARLLKEGKKEDGSPVSPSDIAILFRQGSRVPALYAAALKAEGIPSLYEDKEQFFRKNEILLALCLLNTVNNPLRDIYLAGLLRSPIYRFTLDELILLRRDTAKGLSLYDALCAFVEKNPDFEKGKRFLSDLSEFRDMAEGMPSDKLLYTLYEKTRLFSLVSAEEKKSLLLLYDYARHFEAVSFHGLYRLIGNLNDMMEKGFSLGDGRTLGAKEGVSIVTMHHSKGLEYPYCFVVECGAPLKNDDSAPYYFDSELGLACPIRDESGYARLSSPILRAVRACRSERSLEEELRVLYVGLTRAEESLFVFASPGARNADTLLKNAAIIRHTRAVSSLIRYNHFIDWLLAAFGVTENGPLADSTTYSVLTEEPTASEAESESEDGAEAPKAEAPKEQEPTREEDAKALTDLLLERFSFRYAGEAETRLPRKLSVSRLSPAVLDGTEEAELTLETLKEEDEALFSPTLPRFLSGKEENAAAKAGSATHAFMQFCRFEALLPSEVVAAVKDSPLPQDLEGAEAHPAILSLSNERLYATVNGEIRRLVAERFMDREDAERIFRADILAFLRSPLYTLLLQCPKMLREFRFHALLPAALFTQKDKEALQDSTLLVQGVMDLLLFTREGDILLLDYKTDRIPAEMKGDEEAFSTLLTDRHLPQLTYYAAAIEKIFGKPPSAVLLFSLALGKAIKLPLQTFLYKSFQKKEQE